MTQPADIASRAGWELLRLNQQEIYHQINDLYLRVTDPGDAEDKTPNEKEDPVAADPDLEPEQHAEEQADRQRRLDYETDKELDGDDDLDADYDPDDEPGLAES